MSFNNTYIRILDAYEKEYDAELYSIEEELKEMRIEDQSIRLLLLDASKKKQNVDKIRRIMDDIDRRNAVRVAEIIDQYGWLSPDEIGFLPMRLALRRTRLCSFVYNIHKIL